MSEIIIDDEEEEMTIYYTSITLLNCKKRYSPWCFFSQLVNEMIECEDDEFINECRKLFKHNKYSNDEHPVKIKSTTNKRIRKFIISKNPIDLKCL